MKPEKELFLYTQEFQLLEIMLPYLASFLIHPEMGNGVLAGGEGQSSSGTRGRLVSGPFLDVCTV